MRVGKLAVVIAAGLAMLAPPAMSAEVEFSGSTFQCIEYTNGLGDHSSGRLQTAIARIWILGYLSGYYKAADTLQLVDDPTAGERLDNNLLQTCREYPTVDVMGVTLQFIANTPRPLPTKVSGDFDPATYTCAQHLKARSGAAADANRADIAELWAFAFIQGHKNFSQPELAVPIESKPQIVGAVNRSCGSGAETLYMNMAAAVSEKVRLQ